MSKVTSYVNTIGLLLIVVLSLSTAAAEEKGYPTKAITIINPMEAGGGIELATRALAKEMQILLGQPVIVESRPGATGTIGGAYVANAKPDGYTIGTFASSIFIPEIYTAFVQAPYTSQDLEPVIRWMVLPSALTSRTGMPWNNMAEFIKYVQDNPNKIRLGFAGIGHRNYILWYSLAKQNKLEVREIPYKGAGPANTALLGGHLDVSALSSVASVQGFVQAGRMMLLALIHYRRLPEFPEIPTAEELGCPKGLYNMNGLFVPKGTPEEIKKKIHDVVKVALETPSLKDFAKKNAFDIYYGSAADLREDIEKERKVVGPLIEEIAKTKEDK
jgi:tripartite-type tricarboxylate transporter receptor subunit TctC